jgi:hypothetical protein
MGVRKPAFELVSLWNPGAGAAAAAATVAAAATEKDLPARIAETPEELTARLGPADERNPELAVAAPTEVQGGEETLQAKLCYIPDQLGIFFTYAWLGVLSILVVAGEVWWSRKERKAQREGRGAKAGAEGSLLPTTENGWKGMKDAEELDGGEGKYWKPKPRREVGRWWWVQEVGVEVGKVAAVVGIVYAVVLWRW